MLVGVSGATYAQGVTSELPLFPLGTVLFPGLVMPLHVFEERYRALVRNLLDLPDGTPREFGVVAIRRGLGGPARTRSACTRSAARPRSARSPNCDDGRFDLVTVGRRRFEIAAIEPEGTPYLRAAGPLPARDARTPSGDADRLGPAGAGRVPGLPEAASAPTAPTSPSSCPRIRRCCPTWSRRRPR